MSVEWSKSNQKSKEEEVKDELIPNHSSSQPISD